MDFLPDIQPVTDEDGTPLGVLLHRSSAWATILGASLELAKNGDVTLAQASSFASVRVSCCKRKAVESTR